MAGVFGLAATLDPGSLLGLANLAGLQPTGEAHAAMVRTIASRPAFRPSTPAYRSSAPRPAYRPPTYAPRTAVARPAPVAPRPVTAYAPRTARTKPNPSPTVWYSAPANAGSYKPYSRSEKGPCRPGQECLAAARARSCRLPRPRLSLHPQ